jgi:hypothetical protein
MTTFRPSVTFQLDDSVREDGRILIHSGVRTRNRDWWTGKPYRLIPDGMRIDYFMKNPMVLWMHDFNIPLAKSNLFHEDGMLWAKDDLQFHRRTIPIATGGIFGGGAIGQFDTSVIADMWRERFFNAVSVHVMFRPEDEENIIEEEDEIVFETSEVLEWSICTIPGDPEAGREEMVDRMVHKGMRREIAESLTGPGVVHVPGSALFVPEHVLKAANSGSSVLVSAKPEVKMDPEDLVVETEEEEAAEVADLAVEFELQEVDVEDLVEEIHGSIQEIQIPAVDLAKFLAEDEEALQILAMALANLPGFSQALFVESQPQVAEIGEALPPITIKFVNSGRKPAKQVSELVQANQPLLVSQTRPTFKQAANVPLPGHKRQKKSPLLVMFRKT